MPLSGIPIGGYNVLTERLFEKADVQTGVDFLEDKEKYLAMGETVIYTGAIDAFYDYALGKLEYRTVRFETEVLDTDNYQGVAVVNYTDRETPYTRVIEHKHFEFGTQKKTVISREYSTDWKEGMEPYYPVNDDKNQKLFEKYKALAKKEKMLFLAAGWPIISIIIWTPLCAQQLIYTGVKEIDKKIKA